MKVAPNPTRLPLQANPKIVKKARRNCAAYGSFSALRGEQDHDQLFWPNYLQVLRLTEFGRPVL